jgi:transcription termination/antitermination protein NusG
MDEHEGDEQREAAPFPETPETSSPKTADASVSARESQDAEAASSIEGESEREDAPVVSLEPEAAADAGTDEAAEAAAMAPEEPADAGIGELSEIVAAAEEVPVEAEPSAGEPALTPVQERRAAAAEGLRRGRLPQGEVPEEGGNEPAWYVIHCYSGYENKVRHNLEQRIETMGMKDRIFDVVIPTQEEIEVKEGKRRTVERHIFPGYVLVNMTLSEESWYVVRNTPGVTGFVGMGNLPTPLRPEEVSQIIKRMESDAPAVKVSFKVGERVRIIDGPFNDFRGTVADIDMERTKVRVNVSFFGRETPVELDFLQVEKA